MKRLFLSIGLVGAPLAASAATITPVVEAEETVYTYTNANNGAGPMWCSGSTCLVRLGDRVFASGLETVSDARPLNNCRWMLFERKADGWQRVRVDADGRTREPAPLAGTADGRLLLSVNPTLGTGPEPNGGPARPDVLEFSAKDAAAAPNSLKPAWRDSIAFTEHSYRSFAADGNAGELILMQNVGYTHAEWTFRDSDGHWSAQGMLKWPWGAEYDKPQPIRVCYPDVAMQNHAVHFFGVSDIVEPYNAWRDYKRQLTGREWDYDFRRLFYTWTSDITREPFREWIEIASCDKTCGWVSPGDLWLSSAGDVHLLWSERAIDERLRAKFFPNAKQRHTLKYAVLREGKVIQTRIVEESTEDKPGIVGSAARFQPTPDQRLFVAYFGSGVDRDGKPVSGNRVVEVLPDGNLGTPASIPFQRPFASYFTATVRGGSPPSRYLEMLGERAGVPYAIAYARVRLY